MRSKYDRIYSGIFGLSSLSPIDEYALRNISNAIMNAEVLMQAIPQYKHDGNLDILALIHLHYQNLGAALENIPYETRKQYKDLGAIYGESQHSKSKSFTLRSTVAHYKSFYDLHANFNTDAANNIMEEARETYTALITVVDEFNIPASLRKLITDPVKDKGALLHRSSGFVYTAGQRTDNNSPLDLFSNCQEVMLVTNHCLSIAGNINNSLPMQSLVILARQFIGENLRQAYYVCPSDMSAFLVRVDSVRRTRNKMAHKSIMFEQGADDPDDLVRRYTGVYNNHSQDFDTQIKALREDAESKRPPEAETGSRYAPLSVHVQAELPEYPALDSPASGSSSSSSSSSAASSAVSTASSSSPVSASLSSNVINEFRRYVLSRLNDAAHNALSLKSISWDIDVLYHLCMVLLGVVDENDHRKTADEIQRDLTTLSYIIDNFHLISDGDGKDLINYPMPFDYAGPIDSPETTQRCHQFLASCPYRATAIILSEEKRSEKVVKTIYQSLIVYAVVTQNVAATRLFLDRGGQPNSFVYCIDDRTLPLVYHAVINNNEGCALELMDHGAILNRRMMPATVTVTFTGEKNFEKAVDVSNYSTFERMYRESVSSRLLTAYISIAEKHEFECPKVLWNAFNQSVRFRSNSSESIFLLQNTAKVCYERWGLSYARYLFECATTKEVYKLAKQRSKVTVSSSFYKLWDELSITHPEFHQIAMVFLNIGAIIKNSMEGGCILHTIILFDQNLVEYLCSTARQTIGTQLKEKPKLEDKSAEAEYAKDIYTPGILAKRLGKIDAFYAIDLFVRLTGIFTIDKIAPIIMGYRYDSDEIQKVQSSSFSPQAHETCEPLGIQIIDWRKEAQSSFVNSYMGRIQFENSIREL